VFNVRAVVDVFLFSAFLILLMQSFKDIKTQKIDSRRNWVMQGELLGFVLLGLGNFIVYFIVVFATAFFNSMVLRKFWGEGDKEIFQWLLPGLFLFAGPLMAAFFLLCFAFFSGFSFFTRRLVFKEGADSKRAGVPLIFAAFIMVVALVYFI